MKEIELLAPVGKLENALAAIENGANAIFVGGKLFSARQYAENFNDEELEEIVKYCKLRGVKTHITVNTLVKEDEVESLVGYLGYLENLGVDAVIVQDFGVARIAKKYYPNLILHASTQMSAHSVEDVQFLQSIGFERVVLAREVQLQAIQKIKKETQVEIETFIHGALCYSYSGQCLMSSMIGGRSGNRGRCAQPCRMTYALHEDQQVLVDDVYMLSPKDICTLSILPQLIASGIDSFKIEGRMKSPEYVASVTSIYRKYIDLALSDPQNYKVDQEDLATLQSIFNRGGFSEGYYNKKSGHSMMADDTPKNIGLKIGHVVKYNAKTKLATFYTDKALNPGDGLEIWNSKKHVGTGISKKHEGQQTFTIPVKDHMEEGSLVYLSKNHELLKKLKKTYEKPVRKLPICGQVIAQIGEPIQFILTYGAITVVAEGDVLETAENKPLLKEDAMKQLSKLGATSFVLEELIATWDENGYITISKLNALRREAVEKLEEAICAKGQLTPANYVPPTNAKLKGDVSYCAHARTLAQLKVIINYPQVEKIYWEWNYDDALALEALTLCEAAKKPFYIALPYIIKDDMWQDYKEVIKAWNTRPITGYLVRTYGTYDVIANTTKAVVLDYTFNIMNNEAIAHWMQFGVEGINVSMELSKKELKPLRGPLEKIVYGHLPVMTTEQCILGNYGKCIKNKNKNKSYSLEDRKQASWPIITDCKGCKMQLLADKPILNSFGQMQELSSIHSYRMLFTVETAKLTSQVLECVFNQGQLSTETQQGAFTKPIE